MKKLYTLLCAVAVTALAAGAAAPKLQRVFDVNSRAAAVTEVAAAKAAVVKEAKAPAKAAATVDDILGTYKSTARCILQGGTDLNTVATVVFEEGKVYIVDLLSGIDIEGTFDAATQTITCPAVNYGKNQQGYDIVFCEAHWNEAGTQPVTNISGDVVFHVTETGLAFAEPYDEMLCVAAVQDGSVKGWFDLYDQLDMVKFNIDEQWESTGLKVKYNEVMIFPAFDEPAEELEVTLMRNKMDDKAFALLNPYAGFYDMASNVTYDKAYNRYYVFHLLDNNAVWFENFNTGVMLTQDGETAEIGVNFQVAGMCASYGGETVYGVYPQSFATYNPADGTITCAATSPLPVSSTETKDLYNFLVTWNGEIVDAGNTDGDFKISGLPNLAGVKDIMAGEAVDADAPVEYFNLQGVRVAEPAAGLYIRRQGKNVSKVVIR